MKKVIYFILFGLTTLPAIAQKKINIDSLIAVAYRETIPVKPPNRDSLFNLMTKTKSATARIFLVYTIIGNGEDLNKKDLAYLRKIIKWAAVNHDEVINALTSAELGWDMTVNGDRAGGLKVALAALELAKKINNNQVLGVVYNNLGVMVTDIKQSEFYLRAGLKCSLAASDHLYVCYELGNLPGVFQKPDSIKKYVYEGFEVATVKNVQALLSPYLVGVAYEQTDKKLKLKYLRAAVRIAQRSQIDDVIRSTSLSLGYYYLNTGVTDSTLFYARTALNASQNTSFSQQLGPAYLLSRVFRKINTDSALKYTDNYYALRDSIVNLSKIEQANSMALDAQKQEQKQIAQKEAYQNQLRFYLLLGVILFLVVFAIVFWRNDRQKQKANHLLSEQKEELASQRDELGKALDELKATQRQLVQSEKMASLGELTAGIAHEIQNPLNFVNNFSEVSVELLNEMDEVLDNGDIPEAKAIGDDLKQNLEKIKHHGKRADAIVKGMLEHSRASTGAKEPTDLNKLTDEYLRLAYHGLRAKDKSFNAELVTNFDKTLPLVSVIPQDIGRVMLNLFNNAFYAVQQKAKTAGGEYKPTIEVSTQVPPPPAGGGRGVRLSVRDNGAGIPDAIKDKIMQPFFTTKPTGEGTGLGLSLSYDIVVKGHGGSIEVNSVEGEGTEFVIRLPV